MNGTEPTISTQWWAHLRQRPAGNSGRGLWPRSPSFAPGARPLNVFDLLGLEPPVAGELRFTDEQLNDKAEAYGLGERTLGWLRAWGERFEDLPRFLTDFTADMAAHPDGPRVRSLDAARELAISEPLSTSFDNALLFCGRLDDTWLGHHRRMNTELAHRGVGPELLSLQLAVRGVALREFIRTTNASVDEAATLLSAVAGYDQFVLSLHLGWTVAACRRSTETDLHRLRAISDAMVGSALQLDTLSDAGAPIATI